MTDARTPAFSVIATDAVVFWERGRVLYNLILVVVSVVMLGSPLAVDAIYPWGGLVMLAVIANVLYTSGYIPDLLAQYTPWRATWRHLRWGLWLAGTAFATWLALLFTFSIQLDFGA